MLSLGFLFCFFWEILKLLEIGSLERVHLQKHSGFHVFFQDANRYLFTERGALGKTQKHFLLRWFVVVGSER